MSDDTTDMRAERLLSDLVSLSPMPSDDAVTQPILDEYKRILVDLCDLIKEPRGCDCLPVETAEILLDSVSTGTGFGLYQITASLLASLTQEALTGKAVHCALRERALNPASEASRRIALESLCELAFPSDIDVFEFTIKSSSDKQLLSDAFRGLYRIGDEKSFSVVKTNLASDRNEVRLLAKNTIEKFRLKRAK